MKKLISLLPLVLMLSVQLCLGQNHQLKFDIDKDGEEEIFLFFDEYQGEFEETEFTKFCIIDNSDTLWVTNGNVWIEKPGLYDSKADSNLDNRIGIIKSGSNYLFWLTGFQYGCCYNNTTLVRYENGQIVELFNKDFDVNKLETINGSKYLIGRYAAGQQYGNMSNGYFFQTFFPEEYHLIDEHVQLDKRLTQQRNIEQWSFRIIEPVDVYDARIVILSASNQKILVSKRFASQLESRLYGIISLKKLNQEYFAGQSKESLRRIRNEIFASRGYRFSSKDLQTYFEAQDWYQPNNKSAEEVFNELSEIEKHNIKLLKAMEKDP